jgi:hypothetical protein
VLSVYNTRLACDGAIFQSTRVVKVSGLIGLTGDSRIRSPSNSVYPHPAISSERNEKDILEGRFEADPARHLVTVDAQ